MVRVLREGLEEREQEPAGVSEAQPPPAGSGALVIPDEPIELAWLNAAEVASDRIVQVTESLYRRMLHESGVIRTPTDGTPRPYNLLVTREWMLVVPRRRESFTTISVNALGFAGAMLVRDADEQETLRRAGPMVVLCAVAAPVREGD